MRIHSAGRAAVSALAGLVLVASDSAMSLTAQTKPKTERDVLQEFQAKIDAYMALHNRLEKESPPLASSSTPEQIDASRRALAAKIRAERRNPTPGAIFTPETRTVFRRRLRQELDGPRGAEIRRAIQDDAPGRIPLRVHAEYPPGWPVATVPPSVLAILPQLPPDLDYRFVGHDLILCDVHANLIIDFIRDAFR